MSFRPFEFDDLTVTISELLVASADASDQLLDGRVEQVLRAVRERLRLDVVFVSEFVDGRRVFRFVDRASGAVPLQAGDTEDLETTWCKRVIDGRLPGFIADSGRLPADADLPPGGRSRVGTHLSTPVVLKDGSTFGTLCCYSVAPSPAVREEDLSVLRQCARLVARKLEQAADGGLREQPADWAETAAAPYASEVWQLR